MPPMTPAFLQEFAALPPGFFVDAPPHPASDPKLIALNRPLAVDLGLDPDWLATEAGISMLVGNSVPPELRPLAQVYGGHQFGTWVPRLGDGRAILLGELKNKARKTFEIQLKGAGPTPYSRNGDGRYALGPALREYLVSEAMYALGIPTTRALCVIATGDAIYREGALPGGVLVRVAASHIRVGTFQYFAARKDQEALSRLADFAAKRHFSAAKTPLELFAATVHAQANLVAKWMSVGFVHGVMNTDNMALSGETLDYGPCAFLDEYHPLKVFSSIDQTGRYAFSRQADIAFWNLGQLANAMLPLFDADQSRGIESAKAAWEAFPKHFNTAWLENFAAKLGINDPTEADRSLIVDILNAFAAGAHDFTLGFRNFLHEDIGDRNLRARWAERSSVKGKGDTVNPAIIPRNHQIERAIKGALTGDFTLFYRLNTALKTPFSSEHDHTDIAIPPKPSERVTQTFCGT